MSGKKVFDSNEICIDEWKNFRNLSENELKLVEQNRYQAAFKPGEIIIKQGSPSSNAIFISSGMAKTYIEGSTGKNFLMSIALPGVLLLSPGAFVNSRYTYTVAAITRIRACFISLDIFKQLIRQDGTFAEGLLEEISSEALRSHIRMVSLTQKKMQGRLADALIYFSDEVFKADEYDMILSRQELGEMTNMAKECVVRILKQIEDSGIIYSHSSKIKILDKDKLRLIAEKD